MRKERKEGKGNIERGGTQEVKERKREIDIEIDKQREIREADREVKKQRKVLEIDHQQILIEKRYLCFSLSLSKNFIHLQSTHRIQ